ncbi:hypothetical protein [Arthrobacter mangrovi]|uniref:PQ-loop repeat-containing protein n=1 Tax=Arthrobacter mangrovi TaxID=2966350 RepID=A0ABQ5MY34_9MICC|nr:hypothetical protein [Arthrobacter mangrovi]GLB68818.1 hypothetical protein AHIS1636_32610 [Arthrobacter mangrovi]
MDIDLAILAGGVSTVIFAGSVMPMIVKAVRTRDLASYSLGNLLLSNTGNLVYAVYVYSLPAGPIWALHGFYILSTAFMLAMYLRHGAFADRRHVRPRTGSDERQPRQGTEALSEPRQPAASGTLVP